MNYNYLKQHASVRIKCPYLALYMVSFGIYLTISEDFKIEEVTGSVPSTGFEPVAYGLEIRCPSFSSLSTKLDNELLVPLCSAPLKHFRALFS